MKQIGIVTSVPSPEHPHANTVAAPVGVTSLRDTVDYGLIWTTSYGAAATSGNSSRTPAAGVLASAEK